MENGSKAKHQKQKQNGTKQTSITAASQKLKELLEGIKIYKEVSYGYKRMIVHEFKLRGPGANSEITADTQIFLYLKSTDAKQRTKPEMVRFKIDQNTLEPMFSDGKVFTNLPKWFADNRENRRHDPVFLNQLPNIARKFPHFFL
jgi:hypothetical protein